MRCGGCKAHPPADSDRNARQIRARYTGRHSAAPHVRSALPYMHCSHYSVGLTGSSPLNASGAMVQEQPGHRSATTACSCASNSASFCPHSYTRSPACEIRLRYVSYIYDSTVRTLRARYVIRTTVQDVYTSTYYRGGCLYYAAYTQLVLAQPRVPSNQCERFTYHYMCMASYTAVACNESRETARERRLP